MVLAAPGGHRDSAYLVKLIREQQITVAHFVPSMLRVFLEEPGVESCRSLRHVICSGEALPFDLQERFFELLPAELHNLYGPTEAAVDVTSWTCQRNAERKIVPIGRPIANTQVYVLDQTSATRAGGGARGALHRRSPGRPRVSQSAEPDRGEVHPGPIWRRVQMRGSTRRATCAVGSRMEMLSTWDGWISRSRFADFGSNWARSKRYWASIPWSRGAWLRRERMYPEREAWWHTLYGNQGITPSVSEIRDYLRKKLPDHMVPSAYVSLDEIPMAPNGKVDRRALPAPSEDALVGARTTGSVHDDEVERIVAEIWREVLGISRVDRDSNFFDLGGNSLRLMRVRVKLQQAFHKEVTMLDLLQCTSIKSLAGRIRGDAGAADALRQSDAEIEKRRDAAAQRRQSRRRILGGDGHEGPAEFASIFRKRNGSKCVSACWSPYTIGNRTSAKR